MRSALQLPMLMIRPPSCMCLTAAWMATKTARTLTAKVRSKSLRLKASTWAKTPMPALLTRRSRPPNARRLIDGGGDGLGGRGVGLDRERLHPQRFRGRRGLTGLVGLADVRQRDVGPVAGQPPDDGGADAAAAA